MKQKSIFIFLGLLLAITVSCNDFALNLAHKEIAGKWVNEYTQGEGGILTLEFVSDKEFTWLDKQGDTELKNRKGTFFVYTNSRFSTKTQRAVLVLKFELAEDEEEENFETFFFFFTEKEKKIFLNLQSLTKEGDTYSFLKN